MRVMTALANFSWDISDFDLTYNFDPLFGYTFLQVHSALLTVPEEKNL